MVSPVFGRNMVGKYPLKPFEILGFFQQKRPPRRMAVFWRNLLRGVKWWAHQDSNLGPAGYESGMLNLIY